MRACPRDDRAEGRRSRPLPSATTPQGRHAQRRGRSSDAQIALFLERACHRARDRMPSGKSDADALCPLPQRHRDATPRGECDRARDRSSRPDRHRATEPGTGCPLEKKIEPQSHERDATRQEPRTDRATEPRTARSHRATNEPFDAQLQLDPEKPGVDAESEAPAPALASVDPVAVPAESTIAGALSGGLPSLRRSLPVDGSTLIQTEGGTGGALSLAPPVGAEKRPIGGR